MRFFFNKQSLFFSVFLFIFSVVKLHGQVLPKISIGNQVITLQLNTATGKFIIINKKTNREWTSLPYKNCRFLKAAMVRPVQLKISLFDSAARIDVSGIVTIDSDSSISFLIDSGDKKATIDQLAFPPVITTDYTNGSLVFCYRSSGLLLSQKDTSYPVKRMMVYDNIGLDMPWIGVFDAAKGDGMLLLAETPYDVEMDLQEHDGLLWPKVAWASSLQQFAYARKVTFVFTHSGGYVSLAKAYRNYANRTGLLKTLTEKAIHNPRVNWLKGASVVWGSKGLKFAQEAHAAGVKSAVIMGQWGPDSANGIRDLQFLTSTYENLEGAREGAAGHMKDTMEIAAYHTSNGKPIIGWITKTGIEYYSRSSVRSLWVLPKYMPAYLKKSPHTSLFLDVTPVFLLEDFHPAHRFTREADKGYKNKMKEYLSNDLGLVVGGEHGKAWNADKLDYSEGTMSGSFFWEDGNKPGYLEPPKDSNYASPNFKKYGFNIANKIPLWQLVFNDCVSSTWYWGDSNDWFYEVDPVISDQKDLYNLLYGTMPIMWADVKGYGWDRNRSRFLQTIRTVCNFQSRVAFSELLTHQFINQQHTLQHSSFKGGAQVYVNFSNEPLIHRIANKKIVLAPRGFYAIAPGFLQSKTIDKKGTVTKIIADSLYFVETDKLRSIGPIATKGRITIFKVSPKCWRVVAETPDENTEINFSEIVKNKQLKFCSLSQLNDEGVVVKVVGKNLASTKINIAAGQGIRLFDIYWE